MIGIT